MFHRDFSIDLHSERDNFGLFWSLPENRSKNLPWFPSKREILQSAILFILSTAKAIHTQLNLMKSPFSR